MGQRTKKAKHPRPRRKAGRPLPNREKLLAKFPQLPGDSGRFLETDRS